MYLLGYDVGSSSVKASLVSIETGKCVATAFYPKSEAPIMSRQPGFAEQDPAMWWGNLRLATADILEQVRSKATLQSKTFSPADIKAIGISYQMHGLVPRRPLRKQGLRGPRQGLVPRPSAEQPRQLHRRETRLGEGERAPAV